MNPRLFLLLALLVLPGIGQAAGTGVVPGSSGASSFRTSFIWDDFSASSRSVRSPGILGTSSSGYQWIVKAQPGFEAQTNFFTIQSGYFQSISPSHTVVAHIMADAQALGVPNFTRIGMVTRWRHGSNGAGGNQDVIFEWGDENVNFNSASNLHVQVHFNDVQVYMSLDTVHFRLVESFSPIQRDPPYVDIPVEAQICSNTLQVVVGNRVFTAVNTNLHMMTQNHRYAGFYIYGGGFLASPQDMHQDAKSWWLDWATPDFVRLAGGQSTVGTNAIPGKRVVRPTYTTNTYIVQPTDAVIMVPKPGTSTTRMTNNLPTPNGTMVEAGVRYTFFDEFCNASGSNICFTTAGQAFLFFAPGEAPVGTNFARLATDGGAITWTASPKGWIRTQ